MEFFETIKGLFFPRLCPLCEGRCEERRALCPHCENLYRKEAEALCSRCGKRASYCLCGTDFVRHTATTLGGQRFLVLTFYYSKKQESEQNRVTEQMIYRLKKSGTFAGFFAEELAREWTELLQESGETAADWVVTYLPRTEKKRYSEGLDQSEEIARLLAKKTGAAVRSLFERVEGTEQKMLDIEGRRSNAASSLRLKKKIPAGQKILVVDDVITSGATMETAARLLWFAGAGAVFPVAIAKTARRRNESDFA